ncbi:amino acid permease [Vibrio sp. PP-XX7]
MAEVAGVDAMLVGWLITGIGILLLAGCFLHLSRMAPTLDGGIYTYAKAGFGDIFGFLSAWGYWLCATIGVVGYLVVAFAAIGAFTDTRDFTLFGEGNTFPAFIGESIVLWVVHTLVLKGVRQAALINLLGTLAKILPLMLFIGFAYWYFDPHTFSLDHAGESLKTPFIDQVKNTMLITLWVFTGVEGAIILSIRARKRTDIGKATRFLVSHLRWCYILLSHCSLWALSADRMSQPYPTLDVWHYGADVRIPG